MYSPVHATAGFFIVLAAPHPLVGLPLAIGSHYLLDAIPHGDTGLGPWITAHSGLRRIVTVEFFDLGSAALMVSYLIATHPAMSAWYLLAGAIGGILPDLLWGLRFIIDRVIGYWSRRPQIPKDFGGSVSRLALRAASGLSRILHVHDQFHSWRHAKPAHDIPFRTGLLVQGLLLATVLLLDR